MRFISRLSEDALEQELQNLDLQVNAMFLYLLQLLQIIVIDHNSPLQHCITLLIVSIVFVLICHL